MLLLPLGTALYPWVIGSLSQDIAQTATQRIDLAVSVDGLSRVAVALEVSNNEHPMCQSLEQTKESRPSLTCPMQLSGIPAETSVAFGSTRLSLTASPELSSFGREWMQAAKCLVFSIQQSVVVHDLLAHVWPLCPGALSAALPYTAASRINLTSWSVANTSPWQYSKGDSHYVANAAQAANQRSDQSK